MGKGRPELLGGAPCKDNAFYNAVAVIAAVLLAVLFVSAWFRGNYTAYEIVGNSMQNTLIEGDWVYGRQGGDAARGDIVILDVHERPQFAADTIIKRLIAVEGDAVKCENGKIYLRYAGKENFEELNEPYAVGSCKDFSVCEVGKGEIFVLGDNRGPSHDSSEEGALKAKEIVAVVPQWSVAHKAAVSGWENFLTEVRAFFRGART